MQVVKKTDGKIICLDDLQLLFVSTIFVSLLFGVVCTFCSPRWETNDDVAMSMVAHGYGLAAYPSANIIFSNVLWGHLVRTLPRVNGLLGYSIATLAVLFVSGVCIFCFSRKLGTGWATAGSLTALALLRPLIFPQFTLNSGLLTLAAVLALAYYRESRKKPVLWAVLFLAFFGFLIRSQEFVIVLIASLPFLQITSLWRDSAFRFSALSFLLLMSCAVVLDQMSYRGQEWDNFFEIHRARAGYTDFGLAAQLKSSPSIFRAYGYTSNDLDLVSSFFFSDPSIVQPRVLMAMGSALGTIPFVTANVPAVLSALQSFVSINILPITLLACVLFGLRPSRRSFTAFFLVVLVAILLGLIGRGGLERVLTPLVTMLVIFSMAQLSRSEKKGGRIRGLDTATIAPLGTALVFLALVANLCALSPQASLASSTIRVAQDEARRYPNELLFSWGVGIRIESVFPLLASDANLRNMRIYGLGVFTHAPFSRARVEEVENRGFVPRVRGPGGILLVASDSNMELLRIWCQERYQSTLISEDFFVGSMAVLKRVECAA
jgi:hypothetical protein